MSGKLGFLAVSSQPSSQLPIAEFHEWYEDEHIPLRLDHLPEFLAGARFKVHSRRTRNQLENEDEKVEGPSWLALYFVDSPSVFSASNYNSLRTNRSEREKGILSRIEVMTRLTGEVLGVWSGNEERTSGFHPGRPSGSIVTHGLSVRCVGLNAMDEIKSWMSCMQRGIANSQEINDGWARTHLICVLESGTSHFGINVEVEAGKDESTMAYFVVHGKDLRLAHSSRTDLL